MDLYSLCIWLGAGTILVVVPLLRFLRHDLRSIRPAWVRRGWADLLFGPYFDLVIIYRRRIMSTNAPKIAVWTLRGLVPFPFFLFTCAAYFQSLPIGGSATLFGLYLH
jgi:hypothetical protein